MINWHDGDIVKNTGLNGKDYYRVILKGHDRYATTLPLFDDECFENSISVKSDNGKMYADTGKLAFTKARDLDEVEFVRALTEKEFDKLLAAVGRTIGIPEFNMAEPEELPAMKKELEDLKQQMEALSKEKAKADAEIEALTAEKMSVENSYANAVKEKDLIRAKAKAEAAVEGQVALAKMTAERDVYKELYMQLLSKMGA